MTSVDGQFPRCAAARDITSACEGLTDDLLAHGLPLPSVYLLSGERLRCYAARGYAQLVDGFPLGVGVIGHTVLEGRSSLVTDVLATPHFVAAIPAIASEACAPILVDGSVIGAVNAESLVALPDDVTEIVERAAAALAERISALGGLPRESLTQRLVRLTREMTTLTDVESVEKAALDVAIELSGQSSAAVVRRLPGGLVTTAAAGPFAGSLLALSPATLTTMAGWVESGTCSHVPDADDLPEDCSALRPVGVASMSVYPLVVGGRPTGLLIVGDGEPGTCPPDVVEGVELLAAQVAASLTSVTTLHDLRRRAFEDPLTGTGNFAAFISDLEAALRLRQRDHEIACLVIDVDRFKAVNDAHGHLVGDRLLCDVGIAMRPALRAGDGLYRIGGDEFAVVAVVDEAEQALRLAERLVELVRPTGATVSIGVATGTEVDLGRLRSRADRALYDAKAAGRDTVRAAEPA